MTLLNVNNSIMEKILLFNGNLEKCKISSYYKQMNNKAIFMLNTYQHQDSGKIKRSGKEIRVILPLR